MSMEITCRETKARLDAGEELLLLDCREPEEHAIAAIAGATRLPMSELMARAGELAAYRDKPVIVYCHFGMRSLDVATWLRQRGFTDVLSMSGGIDRWAEQIEPDMPRY